MDVTKERVRIQAFIIGLAKAGSFNNVLYDKTTDLPLYAVVTSQSPKSVRCNETGSSFERDAAQGRRLAGRRLSWRFSLLLEFDGEVDLSDFEQTLLDPLPRVPDFPHMVLQLVSSTVTHPPQQQPSSGTKAEYTIDIIPLRA